MLVRIGALACTLAISLALPAAASSRDHSAEVRLTDDLKPNPLVFRGRITAPVYLRALGHPINVMNKECLGLGHAKVPAAPQVVLTLDKAKRISITGLPEMMMNPGAYVVREDRQHHFCATSVGQGTLFD